MELIQHDGLEEFSNYLSELVIGSLRIHGRVDAFRSRYRKPAKIPRSKVAEGKKGRSHEKHRSTAPAVPSYLATGIIVDSPHSEDPPQDNNDHVNSSNDSSFVQSVAKTAPCEAFAAALASAAPGESDYSIGRSTVFVAPKRQRSFSLSSCYAMRKPGRRRSSSLDNLSEPSSRLLLLDMVTALSDAFPDYDFADTKKDQFKEMDLGVVVRHVNSCLTELTLRQPQTVERLWAVIDEVVNLKHCEIFLYAPKEDEDADTFLWSFHYFFFNKDTQTLCYFLCNADSVLRTKLDSINESDDDSSDMDCCDYDEGEDYASPRNGRQRDEDECEESGLLDLVDHDAEDDSDAEGLPDWDGII